MKLLRHLMEALISGKLLNNAHTCHRLFKLEVKSLDTLFQLARLSREVLLSWKKAAKSLASLPRSKSKSPRCSEFLRSLASARFLRLKETE